jgi:hypothetical protein
VPEDDYFQSVIEATSERLLREAHEHAGITLERISVAIPIDDADVTSGAADQQIWQRRMRHRAARS